MWKGYVVVEGWREAYEGHQPSRCKQANDSGGGKAYSVHFSQYWISEVGGREGGGRSTVEGKVRRKGGRG